MSVEAGADARSGAVARPDDRNARRRAGRRFSLVAVPIIAILALLAWGAAADRTRVPPPSIGGRAAPFALRSIDGATYRLADLRGRVVILNFWASWCAPCVQEAPELAAAWRRLSPGGVEMLGVVYEDSMSSVRSFASRHGVRWPVVTDPGSRTAIDYGVTGIPETVVIAPDGTVAHHQVGEVTATLLLAWVRAALAGEADG